MNNQQPTNPTSNAMSVDEQIQQKNISEFIEKLKKLQEEYHVVVVPVMTTTQFGIFPDLKVFNEDKYQNLMGSVINNIPKPKQ